jgi:hypothetical protein
MTIGNKKSRLDYSQVHKLAVGVSSGTATQNQDRGWGKEERKTVPIAFEARNKMSFIHHKPRGLDSQIRHQVCLLF